MKKIFFIFVFLVLLINSIIAKKAMTYEDALNAFQRSELEKCLSILKTLESSPPVEAKVYALFALTYKRLSREKEFNNYIDKGLNADSLNYETNLALFYHFENNSSNTNYIMNKIINCSTICLNNKELKDPILLNKLHFERARSNIFLKNYKEAIADFEWMNNQKNMLPDTSKIHYSEIEPLETGGVSFKHRLYYSPDYNEILFHLANSYHALEQYQKEIDLYRTYLKKNPSDVKAHNNLAISYSICDSIDLAIQHYQLIPTYLYKKFKINHGLGNCYFKMKNYKQAIVFYEKALQDSSSNIAVQHGLLQCYVKDFQYEKAIKIGEQYIKSQPFDHQMMLYLSVAYGKINKEKSHEYLRRSAKLGNKEAINTMKRINLNP